MHNILYMHVSSYFGEQSVTDMKKHVNIILLSVNIKGVTAHKLVEKLLFATTLARRRQKPLGFEQLLKGLDVTSGGML